MTITFGKPSGDSVFIVIVNSDLTEGRGHSVVHSVHLNNDEAEHAAYGADVQGTDGEVREVPVGIGKVGENLWAVERSIRRFGRLGRREAAAIGLGYADHQALPMFTAEEWERYGQLAAEAGTNPLKEQFLARRAENSKGEHAVQPLHAVIRRIVGDRRQQLVAVLSGDLDEASAAFAEQLNAEPELVEHVLVRFLTADHYPLRDAPAVPIPGTRNLTERTLGRHVDGTVFVVPGETDAYIVSGGKLWTEDGHEADVVSLAAAGLRVRTDDDVKAIAYKRMQMLVSSAPTRF